MERFKEIEGAKLKDISSSSATYAPLSNSSHNQEVEGLSLVFDIGVLVIENPFSILSQNQELIDLPNLLDDKVKSAYSSDTEIRLTFESDAYISISLRDEDFVSPEAASFTPNKGQIIVFN
ncbi:hypothetical protein P4C99_21965 [Pontiellaceae bacterium B1224]|nr:hypothetical protein [Pontiellaceae bacterium B1224]